LLFFASNALSMALSIAAMVYRTSAQPPFAFETVGGGYERIFGRSDMTWRGLQRLSPRNAPLE
jgi:hypothetical protein